MEPLLSTFGIDWRLLLINAVNFGLLLAGLRYFLYKPLTEMLEKRRTTLAEGVHAAAAAKERLEELERARTAALSKAGREADELVARARAAAGAKEQELLRAAEAAAASIVQEAEAEGAEIKKRSLDESRQEVAKLVVLGIEKAMKQPAR